MPNLHDQIKGLLDSGEKVFSNALGRFGEVLGVENWEADGKKYSSVTICPYSARRSPATKHRHIHACTTFLKGDDVILTKADNVYLVINRRGL